MEAVLKVGGSLSEDSIILTRLCQELRLLAKDHRILIVPGGGEFADTVRKLDKKYDLSDVVAHKMGILAMDQYGLFLSNITPDSFISYSLKKIRNSTKGKVPIFLPSKLMFRENPLENSWDVTSDTISAYIADLLQSRKLILITDVDGILSDDPKKTLDTKLLTELTTQELLNMNKRTSVDKTLPKILQQKKIDCYIVNGKFPERIRCILENKKPFDCTHVTV